MTLVDIKRRIGGREGSFPSNKRLSEGLRNFHILPYCKSEISTNKGDRKKRWNSKSHEAKDPPPLRSRP